MMSLPVDEVVSTAFRCLILVYWLAAAVSAALTLRAVSATGVGGNQHTRTRCPLGADSCTSVKKLLAQYTEFVVAASQRGKLHGGAALTAVRRGLIAEYLLQQSVPHAWFSHFYWLGIASTVATAFVLVAAASDPSADGDGTAACAWTPRHRIGDMRTNGCGWRLLASVLPLVLFSAHVARRLWETSVLFRSAKRGRKDRARMNAIGYVVGLSYYVAMPPSLVFDRIPFGTERFPCGPVAAAVLVAVVAAGIMIFAYGSLVQLRCHLYLASLKRNVAVEGTRAYAFPREGWFEHLACPHYTSEIVMYAGLFLVAWGTSPALLRDDFAVPAASWLLAFVFVVCNLCVAGIATLRWYVSEFREHFDSDGSARPTMRYAVIPHVC